MREFKYENNPYTLQFSYIPPQYINRRLLIDDIINDITKQVPGFRCHFITGVRGTGKTVVLADISRKISDMDEWVVVDIENPEGNILESLARGLYRNPEMKVLFLKAKIDLSIVGLGLSVETANVVATDIYDVLDYMLKALKKGGKKVLVAIDEATYCKQIAALSHALSSYARKDYDIFVLMTGLKENIKAIKNDKSLTFLYRAKEHELDALNITAIMSNYEKVFYVEREMAQKMAWLTKGYSFAFQVLGYLYWEAAATQGIENVKEQDILPEYDQYLSSFSYEKIWSELPAKEKQVLIAIEMAETSQVKAVREKLSMSSSEFSVYRQRLAEKGLINVKEYGNVKFKLPRFGEFVFTIGITNQDIHLDL